MHPSEEDEPTAVAAGLSWIVLGLVNVVAVSLFVELPGAGLAARLTHHGVDLGRHVGLGLLSGAVILGWARLGPRSTLWGYGALTAVSLILAHLLLSDDLSGVAQRNHEKLGLSPDATLHLVVTAVALVISISSFAVSKLRRWWGGVLGLGMAGGAYYVNSTISPGSNPGAHFFLTWLSAICLVPLLRLQPLSLRPLRAKPWLAYALSGAATLWAVFAAAAPVSNSARIDLNRWHANILPGERLASLWAAEIDATDESEPFAARDPNGTTGPTPNHLLASDGIVLLLSVDAFRADMLTKKQRKHFPNIWRLASSGTVFTRAYSPGSATVYTLASLSTGKYYSQLYWSQKNNRDWWPWEDDSTHLAQVLSKNGVFTAQVEGARWLEDRRGVMRGFQRSEYPAGSWKWARGKDAATRLIKMIEEHEKGPLFVFCHFLDSHSPYWPARAKKIRGARNRYRYALKYIDRHIGRVLERVEELGLTERTITIITADHGEAFGEHKTRGHATTLYEELIRVPLIFSGNKIRKQRIDELVSVIDLGPTILDLFDVATPNSFMGQSLVPLLKGETLEFERPVASEAVGLRAMIFDDGIKVIQSRKRGIVEVYDLNADPKEERNLSDDMTPKLEQRVQKLERFFRTHELRKPGYKIPYRK